MMRSMFAAVTGLRTHQTMMDVVGNNIANVNTPGFKASQVTFSETISQVLRGAAGSSAVGSRGGINPAQIGLGVKVAAIDGVFTQGASQLTGRATDVSVQGEGFFIVESNGERLYTRNGAFTFDELGNLVAAGGQRVQGWLADSAGNVDPTRPIDDLRLALGEVIAPVVTSEVTLAGNLSADALVGDSRTTALNVFDSLGNAHEVTFTFTKTAVDDWSVDASIGGTSFSLTPASVQFGVNGEVVSPTTLNFSGFTPPGAAPLTFDALLDGASSLQQFGGITTAEALSQNGEEIGFLRNFSISDDGSILGQFSNGSNKLMATIATAHFTNPAGLLRAGDSAFASTTNSGEPLVGAPGTGNRGSLQAGTLEMSNVDLAQEFTNLIIAQRGFQANSRVITASDEMLNELVNLAR